MRRESGDSLEGSQQSAVSCSPSGDPPASATSAGCTPNRWRKGVDACLRGRGLPTRRVIIRVVIRADVVDPRVGQRQRAALGAELLEQRRRVGREQQRGVRLADCVERRALHRAEDL